MVTNGVAIDVKTISLYRGNTNRCSDREVVLMHAC
jgi:hypothetical protein